MVGIIYAEVPAGLHTAAARMVLAHVEHMVDSGRITCDGPPHIGAVYEPGRLAPAAVAGAHNGLRPPLPGS